MSFNQQITPPKMHKKPHTTKIHGMNIDDPYFWFRNRELPEVKEHLMAENQYTEKIMSPFSKIQESLWQELKNRIKEADESYPVQRGDYFYYTKDLAGKEYKVYCRKHKSREAKEEVILDLNQLAQDRDYLQLGDLKITPNNQWMAYSLDYDGSEEFVVYFKNLENAQTLPFTIKNTAPNFQWLNDNKTLFYLELDDKHRPNKVFRYEINNEPQKAQLIFEEKDPDYHVSLSKANSQQYLFLNIHSHATSEAWYMNANDTQSEFKIISPRTKSVVYDVEDSGQNSFFVYTNKNATNFKILEANIGEANEKNWREVISHRENVYISNFEVFKDRLILTERKNGLQHLRCFNHKTQQSSIIPVPEENCDIGGYVNYEFESPIYYFSYSSLITPLSVLSYNFTNQQVEVCKTKEVPTYDKSLYHTERIFAKSHDGKNIPISLLFKKDLLKDGTNPCYLYGYGSYGLNIVPYFRANIFSLIDRGFIFAIAHIRRSSTMGRPWYEDGK
ncbi:MAG: S9 family peptidase, partial [Bdellovibrionales bacterium]|nr:S9 family peptidase [Bdellovibrionales bacterium]